MPIIDPAAPGTPTLVEREPVLTAAAAAAVVGAAITLLVQFGVPITDAQADAVSVFVMVLFPIVAGLVARRKSTPTRNVVEQLDPTGTTVVAGPASELDTGAPIRDAGALGREYE